MLSSPILYAAKKFFYWVFQVLLEELSPESYQALCDFVPDLSDSFQINSSITQYFGFVNSWVPLETGVHCLTIYFEYIITMITIKLVIKLFVPTLG